MIPSCSARLPHCSTLTWTASSAPAACPQGRPRTEERKAFSRQHYGRTLIPAEAAARLRARSAFNALTLAASAYLEERNRATEGRELSRPVPPRREGWVTPHLLQPPLLGIPPLRCQRLAPAQQPHQIQLQPRRRHCGQPTPEGALAALPGDAAILGRGAGAILGRGGRRWRRPGAGAPRRSTRGFISKLHTTKQPRRPSVTALTRNGAGPSRGDWSSVPQRVHSSPSER